jgi:hypothetical protein
MPKWIVLPADTTAAGEWSLLCNTALLKKTINAIRNMCIELSGQQLHPNCVRNIPVQDQFQKQTSPKLSAVLRKVPAPSQTAATEKLKCHNLIEFSLAWMTKKHQADSDHK